MSVLASTEELGWSEQRRPYWPLEGRSRLHCKIQLAVFSSQLTGRFQSAGLGRRIVHQSDSDQLFKHTRALSCHRLHNESSEMSIFELLFF